MSCHVMWFGRFVTRWVQRGERPTLTMAIVTLSLSLALRSSAASRATRTYDKRESKVYQGQGERCVSVCESVCVPGITRVYYGFLRGCVRMGVNDND